MSSLLLFGCDGVLMGLSIGVFSAGNDLGLEFMWLWDDCPYGCLDQGCDL